MILMIAQSAGESMAVGHRKALVFYFMREGADY